MDYLLTEEQQMGVDLAKKIAQEHGGRKLIKKSLKFGQKWRINNETSNIQENVMSSLHFCRGAKHACDRWG